ncbi:MerR family transcriptional regulator [Solihabitans fulvus]|uniref:MerR family transcriptional regulator n=1 Tax=Solihabitans fulvus TaxID=1892852 RepID=A0A5B2XPB6_9PSEU|nr:MerR family transcriptional regulator [Solihabitans fulvus]KAA2265216.1 MerR family transcriptional regulator [Solihabitans fulvus]
MNENGVDGTGATEEAGVYTIGQAADRTGLSVPTIRYYSDEGLVAPIGRTPGGYRLYDREALGRLELVGTLRDLGVDLATITEVLAGARNLAEVAERQIAAMEAKIQTMRLRQAVLRQVTGNAAGPAEILRAHQFARLSAAQRRRLVADLIAEATDGLDLEPGFAAHLRSMLPELPADPTVEQLEAWLELAHLVSDPAFRASARAAFERHAADRISGAEQGDSASWRRAEEAVLTLAGGALADGVPVTGARARAIVDELVAVFADAHRRADDAEFRAWLTERVRIGADARVSRYWRLLAVLNGQPVRADPVPSALWFLGALDAAPPDRMTDGGYQVSTEQLQRN